ncbi:MAG: zinc ribbon domain-containing protein [Patescibacteria group bacterium]|nr:zinc ribbon domain-containing protein [Patescibacteria group bacterium]
MICPKCKSKNQFGNFCSECGNPLKEKCPECGKMEPIGRKICETKLEEARKAQKEYLKNKVREWRIIGGVIGGIVGGSILGFLTVFGFWILANAKFAEHTLISHHWQFWGGLILLGMFITLFVFPIISLGLKKQRQAEQKAIQKFLQEHPDYAEILRQAEE